MIPALPSHLLFRAAFLALGALPAVPRALDRHAPPVGSHSTPGIVAGSYVAVLANGEKLPWMTQVPAVEGLAHWARLDLAVLRLSADGRYTLSYRYAQEVVDTRAPLRMPPASDELSSFTIRMSRSGLPPGMSRSISLSITSGNTLRSRSVSVARTIVATVTIEQSKSGHMNGPPLFMKFTIV